MGALGGLYRPTPRGTMVNYLGAGPSRRSLRLLALLPTAGARRLVGPADWSGMEPTDLTRRWQVLSAANYCSRASNDAGLVMGSWLESCRLAGDYCSHSPSRLVNGAWDPWEGQADFRGPAPYGSDWWRPCRLPDSLWLVGPVFRGSYRQAVVGTGLCPLLLTSGMAWQQCCARRRSPLVQ